MAKKKKTNRLLRVISRLYCWLDYFCRFAPTPSAWEEFFIIYNLLFAIIMIPFACIFYFSCGDCKCMQGLGRQLVVSYFFLGIVFSTIMSIVFDRKNLKNYHRFRSFAGSSFVKQMDEKRHNAGCLVSIIDFIIFFILLLAPVFVNILCVVLITK